jgi:hypothetical protein
VAQVAPSSGLPTPSGISPDSAPQAVQGIVVTAARPKEQILLDRRVYSIATDLQAVAGTAADVLNKIPSVDVDADGNISLRGDPRAGLV